jgi:putative endonuclease
MSGAGGTPGSGQVWEIRAGKLLRESGLTIIGQGYRCRLGELDLIASDGESLIVVEVRARAGTSFGSAAETVSQHKQQRIIRATQHFLMRNPGWFTRPIRFDVIAFDNIDSATPSVTWLKNAFAAH